MIQQVTWCCNHMLSDKAGVYLLSGRMMSPQIYKQLTHSALLLTKKKKPTPNNNLICTHGFSITFMFTSQMRQLFSSINWDACVSCSYFSICTEDTGL